MQQNHHAKRHGNHHGTAPLDPTLPIEGTVKVRVEERKYIDDLDRFDNQYREYNAALLGPEQRPSSQDAMGTLWNLTSQTLDMGFKILWLPFTFLGAIVRRF